MNPASWFVHRLVLELISRPTHYVHLPAAQVRNAMDRARMNSAIRVFNEAVNKNDFDGMVSEKVGL